MNQDDTVAAFEPILAWKFFLVMVIQEQIF